MLLSDAVSSQDQKVQRLLELYATVGRGVQAAVGEGSESPSGGREELERLTREFSSNVRMRSRLLQARTHNYTSDCHSVCRCSVHIKKHSRLACFCTLAWCGRRRRGYTQWGHGSYAPPPLE